LAETMEMPPADMPVQKAVVDKHAETTRPDKADTKPVDRPLNKGVERLQNKPTGRPSDQPADEPLGHKAAETHVEETVLQASETGLTMAHVLKDWKQVGVAIKSNMSLAALLNSCRLLELKNNTLTLGFSSDILRAKADTPEQIGLIRKAIAEVLGVELGIRCVVSAGKKGIPPNVKPDGMVAAALKNGGEIVDTQE